MYPFRSRCRLDRNQLRHRGPAGQRHRNITVPQPCAGERGEFDRRHDGYQRGEVACALTPTGGIKCWEYNFEGQLRIGITAPPYYYSGVRMDVAGLTSGATAVSTGGSVHACAFTTSGGVKCWRRDVKGQLGNGSRASSTLPADVLNFP